MFNVIKDKIKSQASQEDIDKIAYSSDASNLKGKPYMVVWPENKKDIHTIILYAKRNRLTIVPRGAATNLVGGTVPTDSIVLDFSKMDKFEIRGDQAIVQPGVVLDDLNSASEYAFPVVPGSHKVCTLGGMIATNASGMRSTGYGNTCDWVIELDVFDGTGKNIRVKGEQIKDFCGKEGTTGIIVSAKLRLVEEPRGNSMSIYEFDDVSSAMDKLRELPKENLTALEFLDTHASSLMGLGEKNHLIVEFRDFSGNIDDFREIDIVWDRRDKVSPKLTAEGFSVIEDPKIPLENMGKFLVWLKRNKIPCFGHIGAGIIHPHFKPNDPKVEEMFGIVKQLNGDVSGEHGIGISKKRYVSKEYAEEIRNLKRKYDPLNIMNRGKIINEI